MIEPVLVEDVDPADEPITVTEARAQCEDPAAEDSDVDPQDDSMYAMRIAAAREHCENFLGLSLGPKVYQANMASFGDYCDARYTSPVPYFTGYTHGRYYGPSGIALPMGPVRWARIEYGDESDALMLEQDIGFRIDRSVMPNRLVSIGSWPTLDTAGSDAVRVTYGAGYGVDSNASIPTPAAAKMAILGMVAYLFENRGNTGDQSLLELPKFVEALLRPLRVRLGMA